jgi:aminopeptidase YwaD
METVEAELGRQIREHVRVLVSEIGPRPPGSPANARATAYAHAVFERSGLTVERQPFVATWWTPGPARLCIAGRVIELEGTPFSRPCDRRGRVTRRSTDAELDDPMEPGSIVVLDGELAAEPYFPKAFPFLDLPDQRVRLEKLEAARPAAVILIAPDQRPMSWLEDGDLAFPYLVVEPSIGDLLVEGEMVDVATEGRLTEGRGVNLSARTVASGARSVLCAHIDSKVTTPGAIDNAGGVATLLAIAESRQLDDRSIEFVAFNGEDHYAAPGEQAWLASTDLDSISDVVNLDGIGACDRQTAVSGLALPASQEQRLHALVADHRSVTMGPAWFESDHAIFASRGIPSLALTSADAHELASLLHGPDDTIERLDVDTLAATAEFVIDWLRAAT